jgi:D-arabinose 1-dehydrogenase-like Zn-dependent alcohol dehydrogenase
VSTVFKIPDGIASEDAGPLMCGGATVWSPLFNGGYKAGDRIGIIGVGGLGHLAIQFAAKMGLEPIVFSSTESKRQDALALGASEFHVTASNKFEGVGKVDGLLITANTNPDLAQYVTPVVSLPSFSASC